MPHYYIVLLLTDGVDLTNRVMGAYLASL